MDDYLFFVGRNETGMKTHVELEDDLIILIKKHGGNLSTVGELMKQFGEVVHRTITRTYEIPEEGAVYVHISNRRDVQNGSQYCDGLVKCLGFKKTKEQPNPLHANLMDLRKVYSNDREEVM